MNALKSTELYIENFMVCELQLNFLKRNGLCSGGALAVAPGPPGPPADLCVPPLHRSLHSLGQGNRDEPKDAHHVCARTPFAPFNFDVIVFRQNFKLRHGCVVEREAPSLSVASA